MKEDETMSRTARNKSETGIYHIMLRGADRRIIFSDDEDCERFLETLAKVKEVSGFLLYAYCLMGNHVHLLLKEEKEPLELIFKRLGASYVYYYNWKYELRGHLFQDRFRSESIENDAYFLDVLRYICQNPVKAGLCPSPSDYPWLGCSKILVGSGLLDSIDHLTDMNQNEMLAFIRSNCDSEHLDDIVPTRLTDTEAIARICSCCGCRHVQDIGGWEKQKKEEAIREALSVGISIRQLSRLTGVSKAVIERVGRA